MTDYLIPNKKPNHYCKNKATYKNRCIDNEIKLNEGLR